MKNKPIPSQERLSLLILTLSLGLTLFGCGTESNERSGEPEETPLSVDAAPPPETVLDMGATPATDIGAPSVDASSPAPSRPELPVGPNDALAQAACALIDGATTAVSAVSEIGDAGQVLLDPEPNSAYLVTLPESGQGAPIWSPSQRAARAT